MNSKLAAHGLVLATLCLFANLSYPCDVPVFRYALEFWPQAPYRLAILHDKPLTPEERSLVESLQKTAASQPSGESRGPLNCAVQVAAKDTMISLWEKSGHPALPCMILQYPSGEGADLVLWSAGLSQAAVDQLTGSPAREKISNALLQGESSIFVLVESGNRSGDEATAGLVQSCLARLENSISLPEAAEQALAGRRGEGQAPDPPLRIGFSFLRIARDDPAEAAFLQMLLHTEDDLAQFSGEPILFPIYGRGRVLYALVGKGIDEENLREACKLLAAACSCEAKEDHPGVDLLMNAPWEARLKQSAIKSIAQPPLVGLESLAGAAMAATPPASVSAEPSSFDAASQDVEAVSGGFPLRNLGIAAGVLISVAGGLGFFTARRRNVP